MCGPGLAESCTACRAMWAYLVCSGKRLCIPVLLPSVAATVAAAVAAAVAFLVISSWVFCSLVPHLDADSLV